MDFERADVLKRIQLGFRLGRGLGKAIEGKSRIREPLDQTFENLKPP